LGDKLRNAAAPAVHTARPAYRIDR